MNFTAADSTNHESFLKRESGNETGFYRSFGMEHSPLMMQGAFTSGKVLEVKAPFDPPDIATETFGKAVYVYFNSPLDNAIARANSLPFAFQEDWKIFAGLKKSRRLGTGSVPQIIRNKQVEKMAVLQPAAL